MKLLHSKSIRNCTELEEAIHQAEVERFSEMIASLPNYDCDIDVTFEDDYHKEMNYPLAYESNLHRIFEFIETQDIKNGVGKVKVGDGVWLAKSDTDRAKGESVKIVGVDGVIVGSAFVKHILDDSLSNDEKIKKISPESEVYVL